MERAAYKYEPTNTNDNDDDDEHDSNDEISDNDETTAMMATNGNNDVEDLGYEDDNDDGNQEVTLDTPDNPATPPPDENQEDTLDTPDNPATPPPDESQDETLGTEENPATPPPDSNSSHGDVADASGENAEVEEADVKDGKEVSRVEEAGGTPQEGIRADVEQAFGVDQDVEGGEAAVEIEMTPLAEPNLTVEVPIGYADDDEADGQDPPPYGEPPTYEQAVSGAAASPRLQQTKSYIEAVNSDDLEWDRDEPVEPASSTELRQVVLDSGRESLRVSPSRTMETTSFSLPGTVPSNAPLPRYTTDATTPSSNDPPGLMFSDLSKRTCLIYGLSIFAAIIALLLVILLPLTFSYVEYYQYGLEKGRVSGVVQFAKDVYDYGRYAIGPANTFKKYPSWAHMVNFDTIDFYSADGIILQAQISFQYFIKQDELGLIEQKYDKSYKDIIKSVAEANIKNEAAKYTTEEYLSERAKVESRLHDAIRLKLGGNCCPSRDECIRLAMCHLCSDDQDTCNTALHVDVRHFQMKELTMPDALTKRFINVQMILERNEEAVHMKTYREIVKKTELFSEIILNEANEIVSNGTIAAQLIRKEGNTTANAMRESAHSRGLRLLYDAISVGNDQHKASIHWLRTLERHQALVMGTSYDAYVSLIQGLGDDD